MARLADIARLKIDDLPKGVDHNSPLEDQVTYVFTALSQYAKANNWETYKHGRIDGRKGHVTMTYLIKELFPQATPEERQVTQQIVSSVLRRTGAAVCLHRTSPAEREKGEKPTWYVADRMPDNLVVVATHHKVSPSSGGQDRLSYVADRLTPREAGEDREPAPVETRRVDKDTPAPSRADRDRIVDDEFVTEIYEQIATSQVPVTIPELVILTNRPSWAVRHATEKLIADDRLFYRSETRAEKLVRGGGKLPPARPSRLFWPSEPVPERTELPAGIEPVKTSADYAADKAEQRRKLDQAIMDYLLEPNQRQRTSGRIADNLGQPLPEIKAALRRLTQSRVLRQNSAGSYSIVRTKYSPEDWAQDEPALAPVKDDDRPLADRIKELVDELAAGDGQDAFADERAEYLTEIERLRGEIVSLSQENSELKRQVEKVRKLLS